MDIQSIIESLSPLERKVIPHLKEPLEVIKEKTGLDTVALTRALKFLENKGVTFMLNSYVNSINQVNDSVTAIPKFNWNDLLYYFYFDYKYSIKIMLSLFLL